MLNQPSEQGAMIRKSRGNILGAFFTALLFFIFFLVLSFLFFKGALKLPEPWGTTDVSQFIPTQPLSGLPAPEGEKVVTFDWKYQGKKYVLDEPLYASYYQFYKTLPISAPKSDASQVNWYTTYNTMFIQGADMDDTVATLAEKLRAIGEKDRLNENQIVELVATFVQTIPYDQGKLDRRASGQNGATEKITYPYEVLYDATGVCQDKSYLAYALLKTLGYGVAIFLFPNPEDNHMAVGVQCPLQYSNYASGYCFLETTSLGNKIGMIPDLIPQSRIATSDVAISTIGSGNTADDQYQPLGNVEILNGIAGKEYTGIIATISTQKELVQIKKSIEGYKQELKVLGAEIESQQKDLDALEKKMQSLKKDGKYDAYNALVDKYNKLLVQLRKNIKAYNTKVATINGLVAHYRALAKGFYQ